jgi:hypothetical protein
MSQAEKDLEKSQGSDRRITDKAVIGISAANAIVAQLHNSDELKAIKNLDPQVSKIYERLASADAKIRSLKTYTA